MNEERTKALNTALQRIEKDFGKGAVMKFGEKADPNACEVFNTGILGLDIALGVGGIPRGRIVEIFGPESAGKTTVTLLVIAELQKLGGICAFIDAEHALDPVYAKKLGVDINELYISQPDHGEQALEIAEAMVQSAAVDLIIIDSVAALVPKQELDGGMGDSHMGLHARLMSQALRKLAGICHRYNCTLLFTNQLREKIGGTGYGPSETTTGGRALKFYASVRLDIRRIEQIKDDGEVVGYKTKIKVAKNKVAPPFKTTVIDNIFGKGFSMNGELLDIACELDITQKSGSWYSYGEIRLGQGRPKACEYLENHEDVHDEIEGRVRGHFGLRSKSEIKKAFEKSLEAPLIASPKRGKKSQKSEKQDEKSDTEAAAEE